MKTKIEFTRVNNDVNGNPRYVCHFLNFIKKEETNLKLSEEYALAVKRANKIGGRKYNNKKYGGGIVFQAYNVQDLEISINNLLKEV